MTQWLMPAPEYFQAYYFRCDNPEDVTPLIDALRPLRLDGTIRGASHIANDYKVVSALRQYPWDETGGRTPLPGPLMAEFRRELKVGAWNGSGALYGTKAQVKEARRLLRRALRGVAAKLQFLDDRMLHLAATFARPYQWISGLNLSRTLAVLRPVHELMKGVPTDHPLASTYWRKRTPPPAQMDPDRDGCGLLWCSPVSPTDGGHAQRLTDMTSNLLLQRGFEPLISVTMITPRSLACVVSIAFDRAAPGQDESAMRCYQELLGRLAAAGYYSYRLGVAAMGAAAHSGVYTNVLTKIKQAVDPNGILAPGRYLPSPGDTGESASQAGTAAAGGR
jgi:4-cresol dehydrogenase (hydroxylating)